MQGSNKKLSYIVLDFLYESSSKVPRPIDVLFSHVRAKRPITYKAYYNGLQRLKNRGVIAVHKTDGETLLKLTPKGEMEVLLAKAKLNQEVPEKWDGKWRMVIFDIPEENRDQRNLLRALLRNNGFYKLQASVFVHPYPLNREAINYLKESGLIKYIRFARMEEIDDDADLREAFNLL